MLLATIRPHLTKGILLLAALSPIGQEAVATDLGAGGTSGLLEWHPASRLPSLPEPRGVAGGFVGVDRDALIVAGGTTFDKPAWERGTKLFLSEIYVLPARRSPSAGGDTGPWREAGALTSRLGHGAAVSSPWGMVCLGGTDGARCRSEVFSLRWDPAKEELAISNSWPSLPVACEKLAAAIISESTRSTIYVAGGTTQDGASLSEFYALDIPRDIPESERGKLEWRPLPAWPGKPRFGTSLVSQRDGTGWKIYLFGGKHGTDYLSDAYRFDPVTSTWSAIASLPRPALLAPAVSLGQTHILLFSGSDGHDVDRWQELKHDYHFVKDVLAYETITDTWTTAGHMPTGVATTAAVEWQGGVVIPGGELRPSVRTAELQFAQLRPKAANFGAINLTVVGLYLVMLLGMGLYFSRTEASTKDYFLAGRRIPWWAAGLSLLATQVSSIGFLAIPAKTFATNWLYFVGSLTWFIVVPIVTRVYIPFFRSLNVTTAYEYLEARFNYSTRLLAALAFSLLQLGRMGVVLLLPALALAAVTGLEVTICILIMGTVATIYTVAGGMEAVVWTDVVQAVLMLGGAVLCVVIVAAETPGGWGEVWQQAHSDGKLQFAQLGYDPTQAVLWVVIVGNVLSRLSGLTADQTVVQRYLSTSNAATASRALWLDVAVSIPWAIVVYAMGTAMYVFYKNQPELLDPATTTDAIVPYFISQQLPVGVAGLVIAAVFAASMSSLDSSMHSAATVYVNDIHRRFWPNSTDRRRLTIARIVTAALGCFGTGMALYMATTGTLSLWDTSLAIVGAVAGVLAGLFLLGMFTRRATGPGAVSGAIIGAGAMYFVERHTNISFFLYPLVGIGSCFVAGYLVSLILPGKRQEAGLTVFTRTSSLPS